MLVMFLRWQRLKESVKRKGEAYKLQPLLVETTRIAGKQKQRNVAYLGSIRTHNLNTRYDRVRFWSNVKARLDALPKPWPWPLSRAEIEAKIAEVVPPLTRSEMYEARKTYPTPTTARRSRKKPATPKKKSRVSHKRKQVKHNGR